VVLNRNGAALLRECLPSLREQDYPRLEIVVVDNGSTDESQAVAEKFGAVFVALGRNTGFAVGNNRGADTGSGEYLFFVNNDMRFRPNCVRRLATVLDGDTDMFAADAKQWDWEGRRLLHGGPALVPSRRLPTVLPGLKYETVFRPDEALEVPWGSAGNLMVRRGMFEALGGFDETFFLDVEDMDLCWRAWLRGWKTVYVPTAEVFHRHAATAAMEFNGTDPTRSRVRQASGIRNYYRFVAKTMEARDLPWFLATGVGISLGLMAKGKVGDGALALRILLGTTLRWREVAGVRRRIFAERVTTSRALCHKFIRHEALRYELPAGAK
jgi:GT2 family glycosyltransferase